MESGFKRAFGGGVLFIKISKCLACNDSPFNFELVGSYEKKKVPKTGTF